MTATPTTTRSSIPSDTLVSIRQLDACRILVINSKGGAGKTTVATNLAAWLSARGEGTTLIDADPQASAHQWVKSRNSSLSAVYGVRLENNSATTRSFQWRAPRSTRWLITDSPPGLGGADLNDMVADHDVLVIPVLASDIDIRASARFISELLLTPIMRRQRRPVAVVANRVKKQAKAWARLQKFLTSLNIPYPATLRDTQNYVSAFVDGKGIGDFPAHKSYRRDQEDWRELLAWLEKEGRQ
ncbi:MAG: partition-related protein [Spongiibacteraceae bacterium]|jgi:chromosome partitioning protein|nr:partition-related protein [Spongiibacteraceae bacterium]